MQDIRLTEGQQGMIAQVAASMAIEDMPLTPQSLGNLQAVVTGEKTEEEVIAGIIRRYSNA